MDTLEFFQTILPPDGTYYLALIDRTSKKVTHKPFTDLEVMAKAVAKFNIDERFDLYHACASYQNATVEVDGKKKFRVPENWGRAKSFWIDLDCGEDKAAKGEGYLNKKEAVTDVARFCKANNVPMPMFVDSGNGVHCYWVLTKAIKHEIWRKIAFALKAVLAEHGVKADPTCTADFSRILRPIRSSNRKRSVKEVRILIEGKPILPQEFAAAIKALAVKLPKAPELPKQQAVGLNDDLVAHAYPEIPSYAEGIAEKCAQVAKMRDTQGDVGYDHWRGVIGIIKHCEEGIALAHTWSEQRAATGHSQLDTNIRYNTWSSGPTTCEFFAKCNPSGCEGCPVSGKITSPIQLGKREPEPEVEIVEAVVDGVVMQVEVPELPRGYGHQDDRMVRYMKSPDDIVVAIEFSTNLFYPTARVRKESGEYALQMRMHLPNGKTRDFDIDTSLLASRQKLIEGLARFELIPTNNKDSDMHLTAYVRDSLEKLKREAEELNTLTSFGWKDDYTSFLIGDRLYHTDGTVRKVLVGGNARQRMPAFPPPRGTVAGYSDALNYLYAKKGQEHMQYTLGSLFGSLLAPLSSNNTYRGILYALTSRQPSTGKTTVNLAGMYLFGNAQKLFVNGKEGATQNALRTIFSTMHNLPYLLDEFTHIEAEDLANLAYSCANGADRERLTTGKGAGVQFMDAGSWFAHQHITANTDLQGRLASGKANSAAEAVRIMQLNMSDYPNSGLESAEVTSAMKRIEMNMGVAGDAYLKYVVTNREDIMKNMAKWATRLAKDISDARYRFYYAHAECSLAALEATNHLNITRFDIEAVYTFIINLIRQLDNTVTQQNSSSPEDALSDMITALSSRIIVTVEYRDGRSDKGPETPRSLPSNASAAGRYITGTINDKSPLAGKLFIAQKDALKWCEDNRMDLKDILQFAKDAEVFVAYKEKFTLGRGTNIKTGNVPCFCIDQLKLEDMVGKNLFGTDGKVSKLSDAKREDKPLAPKQGSAVLSA